MKKETSRLINHVRKNNEKLYKEKERSYDILGTVFILGVQAAIWFLLGFLVRGCV